ncbi:hypothetical protein E4634_21170 [Mangrovimicrobium sediminis]|uniref:Uncharacterized protein n=1 Tax=Mangrovimicrobium sediminis TaxID=2562682 RepID=A0A4Z0LSR2_9GAMM|nr:hypothetical protein [Haliea sp. SAOS-164]TGD70331.1 hypothetical protein E4634_21170 [Haliea sp. SAOS-164]
MNLKQFVSESLVEIIEGITDAQARIASEDAQVVPNVSNLFTKSQSGGTNLALGWDSNGNLIHILEFDVAVTATEGTETKGGIGVVAGMFAVGSQGRSEEMSQSISRLKFRVPISFPRHPS